MLIQEYTALKIWESDQRIREMQIEARMNGLDAKKVVVKDGSWRILALLLARFA
ncbi:hypothetical protein [Cohnella cholangitidis]|uniref:hypothetical protein n=1 Tax=Cohnella cholangitidis TaxID=2598458 RepID=UPI0015FBF7C3|nr:hypothetical protein [Cohnella cholangitidis]